MRQEDAAEQPVVAAAGSLARNSSVRLVAYVGMVGMGFIYAIVTARWLGPADKGVLATLTFFAVMFSQLGCLGLGDAAVVLVGQGRASFQQALSAIVGGLLPTAMVMTVALFCVASVSLGADWDDVWLPIIAACLGVPAFAFFTVLSQVLNIQERFFATSLVQLAQAIVMAAATVALVVIWELGVLGAMSSVAASSVVASVAVFWLLRQRGYSLRPRWDTGFLRRAVPYGLRVQVSGPPPITDRADIVLVYALGGQAAAGHYSVALTLGTMVGLAPLAISHVSFPRLARLAPSDASSLTARTARYGLGAALVVAVLLLVTAPFGLPVVFGEPYAPAVAPALILLAAYLLSSAQWLLGRAAAARGNAGILAWSYGANLVVMAGLDFVLIPTLGITGAAIGSAAGAAVGVVICAAPYREPGRRWLGLAAFVPRPADFRDLLVLPAKVIFPAKSPTATVAPPTLPE